MSQDALAGALNLLAATSTKSSSGSPVLLIFLVLLFGVYFLWLRPQRNKARAQQAQRLAPEVGDEVVTSSGIIGRVVSIEGDRARVEVAPGQQLTFLRSSIGRRLDPAVPEPSDGMGEPRSPEEHAGHAHDAGGPDAHPSGDDAAPGAGGPSTGPSGEWWPSSSEGEHPGQAEGTP